MRLHRLPYATAKAILEGKLTYVFRKGMISAPLFGAVTTNTSLVSLFDWCVCVGMYVVCIIMLCVCGFVCGFV